MWPEIAVDWLRRQAVCPYVLGAEFGFLGSFLPLATRGVSHQGPKQAVIMQVSEANIEQLEIDEKLVKFINVVSSSKIRTKVALCLQSLGLSEPASILDSKTSMKGLDLEETGQELGCTNKGVCIICLRASLPAATKLLSIVEITKRHALKIAGSASTGDKGMPLKANVETNANIEIDATSKIAQALGGTIQVKRTPVLYQYTCISAERRTALIADLHQQGVAPDQQAKRKRKREMGSEPGSSKAPHQELAPTPTLDPSEPNKRPSTDLAVEDNQSYGSDVDTSAFENLLEGQQKNMYTHRDGVKTTIYLSTRSISALKKAYGEQIVI